MTHDYIFHVHEPYTAVNFCRLPAATAVIPPPNTASLDVETYADRTLQYLQCACTGLGKSNHLSLGYWIMMRVHPFRTILNLYSIKLNVVKVSARHKHKTQRFTSPTCLPAEKFQVHLQGVELRLRRWGMDR